MTRTTIIINEYISTNKTTLSSMREKTRALVRVYGEKASRLHYNVYYKEETYDRYYRELNALEDAIDALFAWWADAGLSHKVAVIQERYEGYMELRASAN